MRIAFLWQAPSGYFNACVSALAKKPDTDLMVVCREPIARAPFKLQPSGWSDHSYQFSGQPDVPTLLRRLEGFQPDLLVVSSWHVPAYRDALRKFEGRSLRVLCMDNQWHGTAKQWLGVVTSPWTVRPFYDRVLLPGRRQVEFARRLGFLDEQISTGLYSCDHALFSKCYEARKPGAPRTDNFLFVGRLHHQKGVDLLAPAFRLFRERSASDLTVTVCGTGPMADSLDEPGIDLRGFVQPDELPEIFQNHGCLLLPSRFEPWGVAIHEAVTAGLSVVCSEACGASDDLVDPGVNGHIMRTGDVSSLADCMVKYASLSPDEKIAASGFSHSLSKRFTPDRWADQMLKIASS